MIPTPPHLVASRSPRYYPNGIHANARALLQSLCHRTALLIGRDINPILLSFLTARRYVEQIDETVYTFRITDSGRAFSLETGNE